EPTMPDTVIACPSCKVRIKVPAAALSRESIRCPKCAAGIRLKRPAARPAPTPPPVDFEPVDEEEQEEEPQEVLPADDEEEEERPRRRRKKKKRKQATTPGPLWIIAAAACPVLVLLTLLFIVVVNGTRGFPKPEEGPEIIKPIVLGFCMLIGVVL